MAKITRRQWRILYSIRLPIKKNKKGDGDAFFTITFLLGPSYEATLECGPRETLPRRVRHWKLTCQEIAVRLSKRALQKDFMGSSQLALHSAGCPNHVLLASGCNTAVYFEHLAGKITSHITNFCVHKANAVLLRQRYQIVVRH